MRCKQKQRPAALTAATADRHHLYQLSVQCVEAEIDMVDQTYLELRGHHAANLREDFCGTGSTSCEWVQRRDTNIAIGFDLDEEVIDWGRRKNIATLSPNQQSRIQLINQDVLAAPTTAADVIVAMNFSYMLFTTRDQLRDYFNNTHAGLNDNGILMLDSYGGQESWGNVKEKTKCDGFNYFWEQCNFNPINNQMTCYIHFKFDDGSKMDRAFSYQWRLWTLPEIRELLAEAGFCKSTVYWEGTDEETGEGDNIFTPTEQGEDDPSWIVYIVAEK